MKDENSFTLVGAVKRTYVNDKLTFAVLSLETSVDGKRVNHEIKCFKENVAYVNDLHIGEVVEISGFVGRMSPQDCEYAKIPPNRVNGDQKYYPAIPTLNVTEIFRDPKMAGVKKNAEDDDKIPD